MTHLFTEKKGNNIVVVSGIFIVLDNAKLQKLSLFGFYFFLDGVDVVISDNEESYSQGFKKNAVRNSYCRELKWQLN